MAFDLDPNYKQVPERIADFKEKFPEGVLRPTDPARPYWLESIEMLDGETGQIFNRVFIVYSASAYKTPDDKLPGIGIAWEPYPGKTPYTKDSELQNAETSAWGRAIVAALASESQAIASAEDVRNRRADQSEGGGEQYHSVGRPPKAASDAQLKYLNTLLYRAGLDLTNLFDVIGREVVTPPDLLAHEASTVIEHLKKLPESSAA